MSQQKDINRTIQCVLIGVFSMPLALAAGYEWYVGTLLAVLLVVVTAEK